MEITRQEFLPILHYLSKCDNDFISDLFDYLFDKYMLNDKIIFIGIKD